MLPNALKRCPKSKKSPNLVTLVVNIVLSVIKCAAKDIIIEENKNTFNLKHFYFMNKHELSEHLQNILPGHVLTYQSITSTYLFELNIGQTHEVIIRLMMLLIKLRLLQYRETRTETLNRN